MVRRWKGGGVITAVRVRWHLVAHCNLIYGKW